MVTVQVDVKIANNALRRVGKIAKRLKTYRIWSRMAEALLKTYWAETFKSEGARRGHPRWVPLNRAYAAYKAKKGQSIKPLIRTGHLQGSAEIINSNERKLEWGTKVPYAEYHQDPKVKGRPPQREVLFITDSDLVEIGLYIETILAPEIDKIVGRSNL